MEEKKTKSPPLTTFEREVLLRLVKQKERIFENKRSDAVTLARKRRGWTEISREFCSTANTLPRSGQQLKKWWLNLKQKARKERLTKERRASGDVRSRALQDPLTEIPDSQMPHVNLNRNSELRSNNFVVAHEVMNVVRFDNDFIKEEPQEDPLQEPELELEDFQKQEGPLEQQQCQQEPEKSSIPEPRRQQSVPQEDPLQEPELELEDFQKQEGPLEQQQCQQEPEKSSIPEPRRQQSDNDFIKEEPQEDPLQQPELELEDFQKQEGSLEQQQCQQEPEKSSIPEPRRQQSGFGRQHHIPRNPKALSGCMKIMSKCDVKCACELHELRVKYEEEKLQTERELWEEKLQTERELREERRQTERELRAKQLQTEDLRQKQLAELHELEIKERILKIRGLRDRLREN